MSVFRKGQNVNAAELTTYSNQSAQSKLSLKTTITAKSMSCKRQQPESLTHNSILNDPRWTGKQQAINCVQPTEQAHESPSCPEHGLLCRNTSVRRSAPPWRCLIMKHLRSFFSAMRGEENIQMKIRKIAQYALRIDGQPDYRGAIPKVNAPSERVFRIAVCRGLASSTCAPNAWSRWRLASLRALRQ